MKFAREFQQALLHEGYPEHWVLSAVPYSTLKKVIKKVRKELEAIGIDPVQLSNGSVFQYEFDGEEIFKPKLTICFAGDHPITATLSKETLEYLKALAANQQGLKCTADDSQGCSEAAVGTHKDGPIDLAPSNGVSGQLWQVEVPLQFDAEFFGLIQDDVTTLDALQAGEQKALTCTIRELSKRMNRLAAPNKFATTDMYRWRALFDIYLQAQVFFSFRERDCGRRSGAVAAKQLSWFQSEVTRQGLHDGFKLTASRQAFSTFVAINIQLLQNLKFQEINQKAMSKILKKFDKRTQLGATNTFPKLIRSDTVMSEMMAKAVCAQVAEEIVGITPQIDDGDYTCPICSTIAWRPIRLDCQHTLCSKCTIELQRTFKHNCPLCRAKQVVRLASEDNIDEDLIMRLKKYFPKETRQKRIQLETEDGIATWGPTYKHPSESHCKLM